jgi:hypothetical protein
MGDGTRLIFWIDIIVLFVLAGLILAGKWDYVIAFFLSLVVLNFFDQWRSKNRRGR